MFFLVVHTSFRAFTWAHALPIGLAMVLLYLWIIWARHRTLTVQNRIGAFPALLLPVLIMCDAVLGIALGTFKVSEDLPLHMCRLAAFAIPWMLLRRDRTVFGVLYFWVLAGTLQAIVTPDIVKGFPSYEYVRYWILHLGLVMSIIYALVIFRFRISVQDFWWAVLWAQIYLVATLPLNWWLGANYGYTMHKPPVASLADFLGPWPWYILAGEAMMLLLFALLYLPFGIHWFRKAPS